jgi:hypothetical protein
MGEALPGRFVPTRRAGMSFAHICFVFLIKQAGFYSSSVGVTLRPFPGFPSWCVSFIVVGPLFFPFFI